MNLFRVPNQGQDWPQNGAQNEAPKQAPKLRLALRGNPFRGLVCGPKIGFVFRPENWSPERRANMAKWTFRLAKQKREKNPLEYVRFLARRAQLNRQTDCY